MIGDRSSFNIKSLVSSDASISLHPVWGYSEPVIKDNRFIRTQEGQLNSFRKNTSHFEFNLPISYISSGDAHTINTWWKNQTELDFIINEGLTGQARTDVKIYNIFKPLNKNVRGDSNAFLGSLLLRSITNVGFVSQPFLLDDPVFGILDDGTLG